MSQHIKPRHNAKWCQPHKCEKYTKTRDFDAKVSGKPILGSLGTRENCENLQDSQCNSQLIRNWKCAWSVCCVKPPAEAERKDTARFLMLIHRTMKYLYIFDIICVKVEMALCSQYVTQALCLNAFVSKPLWKIRDACMHPSIQTYVLPRTYIHILYYFMWERESVFTDHTLAHPLNCRGGVVARLSA